MLKNQEPNMLVTTVKDRIKGYSTRQQQLAAVAKHTKIIG